MRAATQLHAEPARLPAQPDGARPDQLAASHLYLVDHILQSMLLRFPRHVDRDELWSAGALGLVEAAGRFDGQRTTRFAAYASSRVRGAILDAARRQDSAARTVRSRQRQVDRAEDTLTHQLGRAPRTDEVAAQLGLTVADLQAHRHRVDQARPVPLDRPVGDHDSGPVTLADLLADVDVRFDPHSSAEQRELVGTLRLAVANLPDRLRQPLLRHYYEGWSVRRLADDLQVTEARVSQLLAEAAHALRAYLADVGLASAPPEKAAGVRERRRYTSRMQQDYRWRDRMQAAGPAGSLPADQRSVAG